MDDIISDIFYLYINFNQGRDSGPVRPRTRGSRSTAAPVNETLNTPAAQALQNRFKARLKQNSKARRYSRFEEGFKSAS